MKYIIEQQDGRWVSVNVPEKPEYQKMLNRDPRDIFESRKLANAECKRRNAMPAPTQPHRTPAEFPYDFDSGFGIGGLNSAASLDQQAYELAQMQIAALDHPTRPKRKHSGTRYEENCEICGKFSFEICNTCGGCDRCCPGES